MLPLVFRPGAGATRRAIRIRAGGQTPGALGTADAGGSCVTAIATATADLHPRKSVA